MCFLADGDELFQSHFGGEADDFIVARVDFEQQRGFFVDGVFVIRRMGAIGRADFAQNRAALGHDLGNAKGAADLDQLAARDDHFFAFGQRVQPEQHRGGIVIDHRGGFGAGKLDQQLFQRLFALAAFAGGEIVFQIDRMIGDRRPWRRWPLCGSKARPKLVCRMVPVALTTRIWPGWLSIKIALSIRSRIASSFRSTARAAPPDLSAKLFENRAALFA